MCALFNFSRETSNFKTLHNLFRKGEVKSFCKGEKIIKKGDSHKLYFVGRGYIKISNVNADNNEVVYVIYGPGDVFPLLPIVGFITEGLSYKALSDVKLYSLDEEFALKEICGNLELSNAMFEKSIGQYAAAANNMANLGYKRANERVIYKLVTMAALYGCKHGNEIFIDKFFTHKLIASIVHTSRETVTREIEVLRKKGLVDTVDHTIIIKDVTGLHQQLKRPITPYIMNKIMLKKQCKKH